MKNKLNLIFLSFLIILLLASCGKENTSYEGFLEIREFEIWGKEIYDLVIVNVKSDEELLNEGFSEEQIVQFREVNIDDEIKRFATWTADMLGTTVQNSIVFKQYVDKFYDEDISYYYLSDLVQLSDDELIYYFGYNSEECEDLRNTYNSSIHQGEILK